MVGMSANVLALVGALKACHVEAAPLELCRVARLVEAALTAAVPPIDLAVPALFVEPADLAAVLVAAVLVAAGRELE
jgi:hypothetical protein